MSQRHLELRLQHVFPILSTTILYFLWRSLAHRPTSAVIFIRLFDFLYTTRLRHKKNFPSFKCTRLAMGIFKSKTRLVSCIRACKFTVKKKRLVVPSLINVRKKYQDEGRNVYKFHCESLAVRVISVSNLGAVCNVEK